MMERAEKKSPRHPANSRKEAFLKNLSAWWFFDFTYGKISLLSRIREGRIK
jgi:hypothetical protein